MNSTRPAFEIVVQVRWEPPSDDGGAPITTYLLERNDMQRLDDNGFEVG